MAIKAMQDFVFVQLYLVLSFLLHGIYGDYGGWQVGHATFYGGSDASGTMGKLKTIECCYRVISVVRV
jgi:hypothetical protein